MTAGEVILSSILSRVPRLGTSFMGRNVEVFSNPTSSTPPMNFSPDLLWKTQPHLRTVVDFLSRNVAQLGLHVFEVDAEGDRHRDRTGELARILSRPNEYMTTYELVYDLVGNLSLWNKAYWYVYQGKDSLEIQPFPANWVGVEYDSFFRVKHYTINPPSRPDTVITVDPSEMLSFTGWTPNPAFDSSPVDTLSLILEEQYHSRRHRVQVWRNNGRVGSYITRPADAPRWDNTQRARFYKMYEAFVGDSGSRAGGAPLLEDGMDIKQTRFNSADEQWAESVKISLETVAQVYQVNPTMVGVLDNANYSNVREFNKSLYTTTLGPLIRMIEDRLNAFLVPRLDGVNSTRFVEFNVNEKLRGSFEEQAAVANSAVGAPYMTRNELRKINNLPAVEGGDDLITPLNVSAGAVSTADAPDTAPVSPKAAEVLTRHADRVRRIFPSKGADLDRFNRELAQDLATSGVDVGTVDVEGFNRALVFDLENME